MWFCCKYGLYEQKGREPQERYSAIALLGGTKDAVNESDLPDHISFCQPADLPFANDVHRLVSGDRVQRAVGRSKPKTGGDSFLDESVVLFHDVVHVRRWPAAALFSDFARLLQL